MEKPVELIPLEQFIEEISSSNLVFLGEYHNEAYLKNELTIINALSKKRPVQLALEHLNANTQNLVDNYVLNSLSFEGFCEQLKGMYRYKEYLDSCRPFLEAMKSSKGRILAIDSERESKRTEDMAKVIAKNLDSDYLSLVIIGQGHLGETGLPHKVQSLSGDKGVVIACELDNYLKDVCSRYKIEKGIIKVNQPRNSNYVILGRIQE